MSATVAGKTFLVMCAVLAVVACAAGLAGAEQVKLDVAVGTPLMLEGQKQTTYLRVAMTGFELEDAGARPAANVAIVLDKSGSMRGDKIARAKEAAIRAVARLRADDIVSVVAYDETVQVLVPATRVSDRDVIRAGIERLQAGGSTALFAGVSKGATEVKKFLDEDRVNRVILLSDGLANVGPSSPGDLAELGTSLRREGIAVSTIGLGLDYNEDLMTGLAQKSDGNHMFAENATDLDRAFEREFGDVLTVVAQEVGVVIRCAEGIRPVRVIGREADIVGPTVTTSLNQLYSEQMKYVILEVEVPAGRKGAERKVAQVDVSYANMATKTTDKLRSTVAVAFTDSPAAVEKNANAEVMASAVRQVGVERNVFAMRLRDEGKTEEARQALMSNGGFLMDNAGRYNSEALRFDAGNNLKDSQNLDAYNWKRQRKSMQTEQHTIVKQQKRMGQQE
jgi:Ca-activated chloride channel homolog